MKQLLLLLFISFTLLSCSKDEEREEKTTINYINKMPRSFENVVIGWWDAGEGGTKLLKVVGTLPQGGSTGEIELDKSALNVYFFYDENGKTYGTLYSFSIMHGASNNWELTSDVIFAEVAKSDKFYPK